MWEIWTAVEAKRDTALGSKVSNQKRHAIRKRRRRYAPVFAALRLGTLPAQSKGRNPFCRLVRHVLFLENPR
jgi:hypothetical protein